ncbi:hypothetical protein BMR1_03g01320 [Babesia microti strain RI]|uniref:Uncharacterized protein n=1 Tax=Babesia microti (strain RI) TaxID=1133968 RepID=A0A0K3AQF5_BABMR|nr:hypothetical protein BMR1_03g01320 [Babesia microti strain RI]CTQ40863.1 hypothetical protein BMR1_03g01320 [Babesia microti strain RI]|eukprot:XP_012648874.1 hypothetical protein BMR1_03g01320 [Babesia microti strain RI]
MFSHRPASKANLPLIILIGTLGGVSIGLSLGIQSYGFDVLSQVFEWYQDNDDDTISFYKTMLSVMYIVGIVTSSLFFWLIKLNVRDMICIGHVIALTGSFIASVSFEIFSLGTGMFFIGLAYPFLNYSPFYIIEALSGCQKYIPLHHVGIGFGILISALSSSYFVAYDHFSASMLVKSVWRLLFLLPCFNSIFAIGLIANFANSTDTVRGTPEELKSYKSMKYPEKNILEYVKYSGNIINLVYICFYSIFANAGFLFLSVIFSDDFISSLSPDYFLYYHVLFVFSICVLSVALFYLQNIHHHATHIIHVILQTSIIVLSAVYRGLYSKDNDNVYLKYTLACIYILAYISGDGPLLYKFFFRVDMFAYQKTFLSICNVLSWGGASLVYVLGSTRFSDLVQCFIGIMIGFSTFSIIFSTLLHYNVNFIGKCKLTNGSKSAKM